MCPGIRGSGQPSRTVDIERITHRHPILERLHVLAKAMTSVSIYPRHAGIYLAQALAAGSPWLSRFAAIPSFRDAAFRRLALCSWPLALP